MRVAYPILWKTNLFSVLSELVEVVELIFVNNIGILSLPSS